MITGFLACKSPVQKMQDDAESFLTTRVKDPSSYERITSTVLDTVKDLAMQMGRLEQVNLLNTIFATNKKDSIEQENKRHKDSTDILIIISDLKAHPEKNQPNYIEISFEFRAKNGFGALTNGSAVVWCFLKPLPNGNKFVVDYIN